MSMTNTDRVIIERHLQAAKAELDAAKQVVRSLIFKAEGKDETALMDVRDELGGSARSINNALKQLDRLPVKIVR